MLLEVRTDRSALVNLWQQATDMINLSVSISPCQRRKKRSRFSRCYNHRLPDTRLLRPD